MTLQKIYIPQLMDLGQFNPQNNNARMMLLRWKLQNCKVTTLAYDDPDPALEINDNIHLIRLIRRHGWTPHLFLSYFRRYNAIYYPGVHLVTDLAALRWRKRLGLKAALISTLEGLGGDAERERILTAAAGHSVYCQPVDPGTLNRLDTLMVSSDHIFAISPFLARMGRTLYGDKFSVLPLGVDLTTYYPPQERERNRQPVVVSAGRVAPHKRPDLFIKLAEQHPNVRFLWYGEGEQRTELLAQAAASRLANLDYPGSLPPSQLAAAFRRADVFIMPSKSEGVPKVIQEAAACGLPIILYGFYEAPSVVHGRNGYVVWSDQELVQRLAELLSDPALRTRFGTKGAEMACEWDWDLIAPAWEMELLRIIQSFQTNY